MLVLASVLAMAALGHVPRTLGAFAMAAGPAAARAPRPLGSGDLDGDGLSDATEQMLAERHAPIVILDPDDAYRPASIPWLLKRWDHWPTMAPPPEARRGSRDPRDWTTYVHVYPRVDGGINLQYWFLYGYNGGPLWFEHDTDWEHVTVRLDRRSEPVGMFLARHGNSRSGAWRPWAKLRRVGAHPVILSARGTHASYADQDDLAWFERASQCEGPRACPDPVWRTWEGGGLRNLGERTAPASDASIFAFAGRWGTGGLLIGAAAPRGPTQQLGFCYAGYPVCWTGINPRSSR